MLEGNVILLSWFDLFVGRFFVIVVVVVEIILFFCKVVVIVVIIIIGCILYGDWYCNIIYIIRRCEI